jgi:hypothetical protein
MRWLLMVLGIFCLHNACAQTTALLKKELTGGSRRNWSFNYTASDTIERTVTVLTLTFFLNNNKVKVHSCKATNCTDETLRWTLEFENDRYVMQFSKEVRLLLNNRKFDLQFVSKGGGKYLRLRRSGASVEDPTMDYYFQ